MQIILFSPYYSETIFIVVLKRSIKTTVLSEIHRDLSSNPGRGNNFLLPHIGHPRAPLIISGQNISLIILLTQIVCIFCIHKKLKKRERKRAMISEKYQREKLCLSMLLPFRRV